MAKAVCSWCDILLEAEERYDPLRHVVYCSNGCRDADTLFQLHYSDENINRERHYEFLTRGIEDGQG